MTIKIEFAEMHMGFSVPLSDSNYHGYQYIVQHTPYWQNPNGLCPCSTAIFHNAPCVVFNIRYIETRIEFYLHIGIVVYLAEFTRVLQAC